MKQKFHKMKRKYHFFLMVSAILCGFVFIPSTCIRGRDIVVTLLVRVCVCLHLIAS